MHSKHYCIIYGKTISNFTKNDTNIPSSAGTGTIEMMEWNTALLAVT